MVFLCHLKFSAAGCIGNLHLIAVFGNQPLGNTVSFRSQGIGNGLVGQGMVFIFAADELTDPITDLVLLIQTLLEEVTQGINAPHTLQMLVPGSTTDSGLMNAKLLGGIRLCESRKAVREGEREMNGRQQDFHNCCEKLVRVTED